MTIPPSAVTTAPSPEAAEPAASRGERLRVLVGSPRAAFVLQRLGRAAVSFAIVLVAAFFMVQLVPGDPVRAALGPTAPVATVDALRAQLGLDQSVWSQFGHYVSGLLHGDLGMSITSQRQVSQILGERLPTTLVLAVVSFLVAAIGAFPIGVATAVSARSGRHRVLDLGVSGLLGILIAVPNFLLAVLLIATLSIGLGAFPPAGWGTPSQAVLPVLALALGPLAYLARIVHIEMLRVLDTPYLTTARSKRLPGRLLYLRHALPNIVAATLTAGGVVLVGLVAGTVLVETVFTVPGIGSTIVSSITAKDYPLIQGVVLVYALLVLGANLLIDLALAILDPRSAIAEA
ncbi:ABC transporter permease [Phycicoccus endophyticus]|uniref:ABC transporter permease n=1 Tax=Phycicoccus endophyticus TaxID=1690220 RepID=A0A7G9QZQ1_9MICO|nr:ABC transporter permease [Phycicoccus endophyticus]NHI20019.1 ABC transporter permease [Phycicoccus endophyticus]QNN48826.1 ABC transporter permease [Phycicoccus endophyticus]GGL42555.1 peptide ABC transporter permease [Phycicoccus endophyticus]